ncbi:caspase family protein [Aestuariivirga sp.]|uniref:caspase family protein n=1 Tax=Aestuariivirga sp. TaxID=2650926 RepID=UPI0039E482F6
MGSPVRIIAVLAALIVLSGAAPKGGRVALVIGNGSYEAAGTLSNPVNDAEDIAAKLRSMGFTVVDGYDLGKRQLEAKIGEFADALDGADAGLFYYAGHGIAVDGRNFIIPIDAHLDIPAKLKLEAIPMDDVLDLMSQQVKTSILILDACRNNPFARGLRSASTTRAVTAAEGLAQFDSAKGSFIAFSTAPGATAMDGTGRNSPFAAALLKHLDEPGASINDVMTEVRGDVAESTKDFQTPMAWDSLTSRFELVPGAPKAAETAPPAQVASAPDAKDSLENEVGALVVGQYLKPNPADIPGAVRNLFADQVTSFGREYSRDELVALKAQWFAKYSRWKLQLVPGTLKVTSYDAGSAMTTFDMRYKYWPKEAGYSPIAGTAHVTLELMRDGNAWKIESENSAVDQ